MNDLLEEILCKYNITYLLFFNELRENQWFLIKVIVILVSILLCGTLDTPAQSAARSGKVRSASNQNATENQPRECRINLKPDDPKVIRLAISPNAVSIVEFPANDSIYYVHEGNPKLVLVFQSPTRSNDHSITFFPGEELRVPSEGKSSVSATVTLQMRSGMIVTFRFFAVPDPRQNSDRCVVSYDREAIVAARRTAGLAVNLGESPRQSEMSDRSPRKIRNSIGCCHYCRSFGWIKQRRSKRQTTRSGPGGEFCTGVDRRDYTGSSRNPAPPLAGKTGNDPFRFRLL